MITLLLYHTNVLREPLLHLSLYFKQHRSPYYELLDRVRRTGESNRRVGGVARVLPRGCAGDSDRRDGDGRAAGGRISKRPFEHPGHGRRAGSALRVHDAIKARPIVSLQEACRLTGLSFPAASSSMSVLGDLGIARELTGKRRGRLFVYDRYLAILNEGTD